MATVNQFIDAAKAHTGKTYLFGAKGPDKFDCSGLITFALAAVGVAFPHGSFNQIAATTALPVEEAITTAGALLYRPGHIAISLGDGTTFEARNPDHKIGSFSAHGRGWTKAGVIPALKTEENNKMYNPVAGRVSSRYGWRTLSGVRNFHAGLDIAAPLGSPVRAMFAGVVDVAVGDRVHDRTAAQVKNRGKAAIAPHRSGNGVRVRGYNVGAEVYGHIRPIVRKGDHVEAGQILGHIDLSGNTTGPHVHLEIWSDADNHNSHINPELTFRRDGVTPGVDAVAPPKEKPVTPAKPAGPNATVRARLKKMGLPETVEGVKTYQRAHGLYPDGDWGGVTDRMYLWVVSLQSELNRWKAVSPKLYVDGYRGRRTVRGENQVIARNAHLVGRTLTSLYRYLGIPEPTKRP